MKTRKQAATDILALHNAMEKPVRDSTIYRHIFRRRNGNWSYIGKGYDYTA